MLLVLRLFQGIGVAAVGLACRSILGDVFVGRRLAIALTYFTMSYRIGPIIAPLIGGYLEAFVGWQASFYFLALYGLIIFGVVLSTLPETHFERISIHPKAVILKYRSLLKLPSFVGGALCIGTNYSLMIIFNVIGPFFIQTVLGYSPVDYGHIAFVLGIFAFLGILANRLVLHRFSPKKIVKVGIYSLVGVTVLQVIFALIFPVNLYSFLVPVAALLFTSGLIVSNITSLILGSIPKGMGTSSALISIIIISSTGVLTALSSFLKSNTALPFAIAFLAIMLGCYASYRWLFCRGLDAMED